MLSFIYVPYSPPKYCVGETGVARDRKRREIHVICILDYVSEKKGHISALIGHVLVMKGRGVKNGADVIVVFLCMRASLELEWVETIPTYS